MKRIFSEYYVVCRFVIMTLPLRLKFRFKTSLTIKDTGTQVNNSTFIFTADRVFGAPVPQPNLRARDARMLSVIILSAYTSLLNL